MRVSPAIVLFCGFCLVSPATLAQSSSGSDDSGNPFSAIGNLFSSGTETKVTAGQDAPNINEVQSEAYDGPKARVAVARFTDKTRKGWYTGHIGDGMADQLATALFNTNRYILLERQTLGDVLKEQDLGAAGRISRETAAPVGQIEGAEILITGAVTEFEPGASGAGGRTSGGGGMLGNIVGAVSGAFSSAHIAIDLRLIDTRTSRVLAATSVEGKTTDVDVGGALGGYFGGGRLGGALSAWDNEPIGKALRIAINDAVDFVVSKTPPIYYRHGAGGTASRAPAASGSSQASPASAAPKASGGGVAERLTKLKALFDQGLISESEYNTKRKEILESL